MSKASVGLIQKQLTARASLKTMQRGFTIVELLIVVVVIAILAAITIVSYNGITNSAKESALKSDLTTAAKRLQVERINSGSFPSIYVSTGLTYSGGGNAFCIFGVANGSSLRITEAGSIQEGDCTASVATTMQTFTSAHCSALPIYTGSNSEAIVSLDDSRGGATQTYEVAKLADNKCWMLTNLKLGSTTGTVNLTQADSNVGSNFTLPQLITTGSSSYDLPQAIGPVTGDTGSGVTNYGYLYNWSAATAGESRTSHDETKGNAPYSICPASWRLPTGGSTGEFAMLNAKMNNLAATNPSTSGGTGYYQNWQTTGAFKGVFSGWWGGSFGDQGDSGYVWSGSANPGGANSAFNAYFDAGYVSPGDGGYYRDSGLSVRCLLN